MRNTKVHLKKSAGLVGCQHQPEMVPKTLWNPRHNKWRLWPRPVSAELSYYSNNNPILAKSIFFFILFQTAKMDFALDGQYRRKETITPSHLAGSVSSRSTYRAHGYEERL